MWPSQWNTAQSMVQMNETALEMDQCRHISKIKHREGKTGQNKTKQELTNTLREKKYEHT